MKIKFPNNAVRLHYNTSIFDGGVVISTCYLNDIEITHWQFTALKRAQELTYNDHRRNLTESEAWDIVDKN